MCNKTNPTYTFFFLTITILSLPNQSFWLPYCFPLLSHDPSSCQYRSYSCDTNSITYASISHSMTHSLLLLPTPQPTPYFPIHYIPTPCHTHYFYSHSTTNSLLPYSLRSHSMTHSLLLFSLHDQLLTSLFSTFSLHDTLFISHFS